MTNGGPRSCASALSVSHLWSGVRRQIGKEGRAGLVRTLPEQRFPLWISRGGKMVWKHRTVKIRQLQHTSGVPQAAQCPPTRCGRREEATRREERGQRVCLAKSIDQRPMRNVNVGHHSALTTGLRVVDQPSFRCQ